MKQLSHTPSKPPKFMAIKDKLKIKNILFIKSRINLLESSLNLSIDLL